MDYSIAKTEIFLSSIMIWNPRTFLYMKESLRLLTLVPQCRSTKKQILIRIVRHMGTLPSLWLIPMPHLNVYSFGTMESLLMYGLLESYSSNYAYWGYHLKVMMLDLRLLKLIMTRNYWIIYSHFSPNLLKIFLL